MMSEKIIPFVVVVRNESVLSTDTPVVPAPQKVFLAF